MLGKQASDGTMTELPLRYVYDYLAGPYDPQQALQKGKPGVGGYPNYLGSATRYLSFKKLCS